STTVDTTPVDMGAVGSDLFGFTGSTIIRTLAPGVGAAGMVTLILVSLHPVAIAEGARAVPFKRTMGGTAGGAGVAALGLTGLKGMKPRPEIVTVAPPAPSWSLMPVTTEP